MKSRQNNLKNVTEAKQGEINKVSMISIMQKKSVSKINKVGMITNDYSEDIQNWESSEKL